MLEKHGDFLREFRGDTVHSSTMQILHELGWLTEFLKRPHQKAEEVSAFFGDRPCYDSGAVSEACFEFG